MLVFHGTDYAPVVFGVGLFALSAGLEYLLCVWSKRRWVRLLPLTVAALFLALAAGSLLFRWGDGGWLDLSALFALLFVVCAAICGAGVLLGRLLWRRRIRRKFYDDV